MKSRHLKAIAAVLVVGGLVGACSSDDGDGDAAADATVESVASSETGASSASTPDTTAPDVSSSAPDATEPAATQASSGASTASTSAGDAGGVGNDACVGTDLVTEGVDREATVKIPIFGPMVTADPHAIGASPSAPYNSLIYDRLFWLSRSGELCPYLVREWEFVDGDLVLSVRDDATFHDGSPVDANAVKANIDRAHTMETSAFKAQLRNLESVDVVDDYTVRLNLLPNSGNSIAYSLAGFAGMMINPDYMDPDALKSAAPAAVGSGPYQVAEWTPGDPNMVFERAGTHWDPAAGQAARIEMYTLPDPSQQINSIKAGEMDMALLGGPSAARGASEAESDDNVQAGGLESSFSSTGMWMQDRVDPIVREAMSYALDRETLGELYEGGAGVNNQLYPADSPLHSSAIDDSTVYDPDKARDLIAAAPDGSTSFTMAYTDSGVSPQLAELVQAQMAAVGIDISLQPFTANSISEAWFNGSVDVLLQGSAATPHPPILIDAILLRGGNVWAAPDSALEELNAELNTADDPALDDEERDDIYNGILQRAADEHWMLVFNQSSNTTFATSQMVNVTPELPFQYQSLPDYRYVAKASD